MAKLIRLGHLNLTTSGTRTARGTPAPRMFADRMYKRCRTAQTGSKPLRASEKKPRYHSVSPPSVQMWNYKQSTWPMALRFFCHRFKKNPKKTAKCRKCLVNATPAPAMPMLFWIIIPLQKWSSNLLTNVFFLHPLLQSVKLLKLWSSPRPSYYLHVWHSEMFSLWLAATLTPDVTGWSVFLVNLRRFWPWCSPIASIFAPSYF